MRLKSRRMGRNRRRERGERTKREDNKSTETQL